jgi:hypothetical protein
MILRHIADWRYSSTIPDHVSCQLYAPAASTPGDRVPVLNELGAGSLRAGLETMGNINIPLSGTEPLSYSS